MTGSSLRALLREGAPARRFAEDVRPAEETEICPSFTFGRTGIRPQLMLGLVKSHGHLLVLPYADLRAITTSDLAKGCEREFSGREIVTKGTNLEACFRYLRDHRLSELVEADRPAAISDTPDASVVQTILIRKPRFAPPKR